ncbi:TetR/AcrR family transcriptional regulator [Haliea atlantica]
MATQTSARGRKPSLSREKIVQRTLELLAELPPDQFSLRRLAQSLGITPAALYAYFSGQEELLKAAAMEVANGIDLSGIDEAGPWRDNLQRWAQAVRARYLQYPHIALLMQMSPYVPPGWFRVILPVLRLLRASGLRDEALLVAFKSFIRGVAGLVMVELQHDAVVSPVHRQDARDALTALSEGDRRQLEELLPRLGPDNSEELFNQTVEVLLEGIAVRTRG